jgi:hypothetical protein
MARMIFSGRTWAQVRVQCSPLTSRDGVPHVRFRGARMRGLDSKRKSRAFGVGRRQVFLGQVMTKTAVSSLLSQIEGGVRFGVIGYARCPTESSA